MKPQNEADEQAFFNGSLGFAPTFTADEAWVG
jgi:hypothetical protein